MIRFLSLADDASDVVVDIASLLGERGERVSYLVEVAVSFCWQSNLLAVMLDEDGGWFCAITSLPCDCTCCFIYDCGC